MTLVEGPDGRQSPISVVSAPLGSSTSLELKEWQDAPTADQLGSSIFADRVFRVDTREELARVLEMAGNDGHVVRALGAGTSSKAFTAPPRSFMEGEGKKGLTLVAFGEGPNSEFKRCEVDLDRGVVHVGAGVSLDEVARVVKEASYGRLENPLTITTMDAKAVATALGSGGVADSSDSAFSTMAASKWMDGRGRIHEERYKLGSYFDPETSSFYPVHPHQIGREMTGRGGPFGVGMEVSLKLRKAPRSVETVIFPFSGTTEEVRARLMQFILEMNQKGDAVESDGPVELRSLEVMDREAMTVAGEVSSWRPKFSGDEAKLIVIADFGLKTDESALGSIYEAGFLPDDFVESDCFQMLGQGDKELCRTFRLHGPDHMRTILKRDFPDARTESTDWAVDATDPSLVQWYFEQFFALHDQIAPHAARQALYGHARTRLDFHHRKIVRDRLAMDRYDASALDLSLEFTQREKAGKNVRGRGEKVEQSHGHDLLRIGLQRERGHQASNVALLNDSDPAGLFLPQAPERWKEERY